MDEHRDGSTARCLRIAAAGDVHCAESNADGIRRAFAALNGEADLVLLAGDLTTHGEPEQVELLAQACAAIDVPVFAVLGNHDWHANRYDALVAALESGGFPGSHLPDFGEPMLRAVYHETSVDVEALDRGLREIALCPARIVLLHYAPTQQTITGEPPGIWGYLGTDRLAAPIAKHEPDLVLHGRAHSGTFEGAIGTVPVYNVSVPVIARDFWLFELDVPIPAHAPIH
jgi:uncharacterized protein